MRRAKGTASSASDRIHHACKEHPRREGKLNGRQFLERLTVVGGTAGLLNPVHASTPAVAAASPAPQPEGRPEGNTYPVLGYKRMILDYHFSEFNPLTLQNANAQEIVDAMVNLGIHSLLLYSKDCPTSAEVRPSSELR